jgi:hypothetical protein
MANNISVTAGSGTVLKTTDNSGVHTPHHNLDVLASAALDATSLGARTDAKSTATDATAVSAIALLKQISASVQAPPPQGYGATVQLTRPNDTSAYAAGDVIGAATGSTAALTFSNVGPSGGEIVITSASLMIEASALISGELSYRLYLYRVTPPSAPGDNAAWDIPSGDRASCLGFVDLGAPVDLGSTLYVEQNGINKQVKLAGTNLYGLLVTNGAFTPTANRVHDITLHTMAA